MNRSIEAQVKGAGGSPRSAIDEVLQLLGRCGLFRELPTEVVMHVAERSRLRRHPREEVLWHVGDPAQALLVVGTGLIKVVRPTRNGRAVLCGLFGPSDTVGELPVLKGAPYPASAVVASTVAQVLTVPRAALVESIERCPPFGMALVSGFHEKVEMLHTKIEVLSAGAVEARLAMLMLHLGERFGRKDSCGEIQIPLSLSRQELADTVSTSFETVVRTMSRWSREGIVRTEDWGFVLVRPAELERALDGRL